MSDPDSDGDDYSPKLYNRRDRRDSLGQNDDEPLNYDEDVSYAARHKKDAWGLRKGTLDHIRDGDDDGLGAGGYAGYSGGTNDW